MFNFPPFNIDWSPLWLVLQSLEFWMAVVVLLIFVATMFSYRYKNWDFFYGFCQGHRFLKKHGDKIWSDQKQKTYLERYKAFALAVRTHSAEEKICSIEDNLKQLREQKKFFENKYQRAEKQVAELEKTLRSSSEELALSTWKKIFTDHEKDLKKLRTDVQQLEGVELSKKNMAPLLDSLEEELRYRSNAMHLRVKEIEKQIKSLEKEILTLQRQNAETLNRRKGELTSFAEPRLKNTWNNLVAAAKETQTSILKYLLFGIVVSLLLVDFVVPFQYFTEHWSHKLDSVILNFLGFSFTYHHLSIVIAVVIILAILVFLELLLEDFWTKENKKKSTIHRISFYLFCIFNLICAVSAFYYWYEFRQSYDNNIDQMLLALTLPVATSAALIIKKLKQKEGFHFIFAPLKVVWFLLEIPGLILIDMLLWIKFQFASSIFHEIRRRNKTIRTYRSEIEHLKDQKDELIQGFEAFKKDQDSRINVLTSLREQIRSLEEMLHKKLTDFSQNFQEFRGLFEQENKKALQAWITEAIKSRTLLHKEVNELRGGIGYLAKEIERQKTRKKFIREGIEAALQRGWKAR